MQLIPEIKTNSRKTQVEGKKRVPVNIKNPLKLKKIIPIKGRKEKLRKKSVKTRQHPDYSRREKEEEVVRIIQFDPEPFFSIVIQEK